MALEYILDCDGKPLNLSHPCVMGILNVTPDSFSDGGHFIDVNKAVAQAKNMAKEGAAIIDIGGESTRPGAVTVSIDEELRRVIPVIKILAAELTIPISIDTYKPQVMLEAVAAGAGFINDTNALRTSGALEAAKFAGVPICLMHKQGEPQTMQQQPQYQDVVAEVLSFLRDRVAACEAVGISHSNLVIDPGFGFGKTLQHNLILFRHLHVFRQLNLPLLLGISRKSMLGAITHRAVEQRLPASIAAAVLAAYPPAAKHEFRPIILRVHDVAATVDALTVAAALC